MIIVLVSQISYFFLGLCHSMEIVDFIILHFQQLDLI